MRSQRVKRVKRSKKSKMLKRKQINRRTKRVSRVKRSKRTKRSRMSRRSQINRRSRRTQRTRRNRRMRGGMEAGGAAGGAAGGVPTMTIEEKEKIFNKQISKARELIQSGNNQEALELLTRLSTANKPGWSPNAPAIEERIQKLIAIAQLNLGQSTEMGERLRQKALVEKQQVEAAKQAKAAQQKREADAKAKAAAAKAAQQKREADAKAKAAAAKAALEQKISLATFQQKKEMDLKAISEINRLKSEIESLPGKENLSSLDKEGLLQLIRYTSDLKKNLDIRNLIDGAGRFTEAKQIIQIEFKNLMNVLKDHSDARNQYELPSIPE